MKSRDQFQLPAAGLLALAVVVWWQVAAVFDNMVSIAP